MKNKKILIFILTIFITMGLYNILPQQVSADNIATSGIPYTTYTLGVGNSLIPTQTAYVPVGIIGEKVNLNNAQDIFYYNSTFYIANTGSKSIVQIDSKGTIIKQYLSDEFVEPTGVFVTEEAIYIADKGARSVFKISHELTDNQAEILLRVVKPTSAIFGDKAFIPTKVAVKTNKNMYIIGEGSTNGIIEVNYEGEFLGYLGINSVEISLRRILYNFFVKDGSTASSMPASPINVAIGEKGSILSINQNITETFKRLNITGINTLQGSTYYPQVTLTDIIMSDGNYIYIVAETGEIYEYDSKGNLIFHFVTRDESKTQSLGLTSKPSGICIDANGNIYILDQSYNNIQVYQKTVFVDLVHEAVNLYNEGRYIDSKPLWEEILRQNTSFALAHTALGSAFSKEGKYQEALEEFKIAKDYGGYSNAYWEIRNAKIQSNLPLWVCLLLIILVVLFIINKLVKTTTIFDKVKDFLKKIASKKLISELLFGLKIFKRPSDVFYGIKKQNKASVKSGIIILIIFILVYLIDIYFSGFLFKSGQSLSNVLMQLVIVLGIFILFIVVNYFVSTLTDGEGWLKDIFIASSYALIPFIVLTLPMTLLSHILTYNESFIVSLYDNIVLIWTFFLLIYAIKEIHNYSFKKTIGSTLIIIFGMAILVIIGLLVYSFLGQLLEFVVGIVREVFYRAL